VCPSEVEAPSVNKNQVVIDVKAAGVNFVDTLYVGPTCRLERLVTARYLLQLLVQYKPGRPRDISPTPSLGS